MADRIKVGVKVRPLIQREKIDRLPLHWKVISDNQIVQLDPTTGKPKAEPHVFDHVFGPSSSNEEVFETLVKPIVESAVKGFNGTIFAYGQTASGKTYTMMGDQYEPGIIPQAVNLIFNTIENTHGREFLLRVCYMEIYNEKVNDLLVKSHRNLKVSEDMQGNVFVKDLEESITNSAQMVMDLMKKGETIRKIGVTNMNERSSRSHSIFRVIIESRLSGSDAEEAIQVSHLNLVDLAGSERAGATGSVGEQFKEGCAINTSLFTLGKVIAQLSEGDASYVNFRDSKLTRILQSSLGGNALTAIICAVTPAVQEETSSTLGFATRARNIKVTATVNEVVSDRALLKRYIRQIDRLNGALSTLEEEKTAENRHLQDENSKLQERINRLKDALLVSSADFSNNNPDKTKEKMKALRRRTWSAPNRNTARLSLAFPIKSKTSSVSHLSDIKEETSGLSFHSVEDSLNDSNFSTPLEEFERALINAERAKSIDETDWLQSVDSVDEDPFEEQPPINYVQTRRPRIHMIKEQMESVVETPPSKLRAQILDVEQELQEMTEYTRLEKQMFDEQLSAELDKVKNELQKSQIELESLRHVKEQMAKLKQDDRNTYDYQLLLMDSSKEVSKLRDMNREIQQQLADAVAGCQDLAKLKEKLDHTTKLLSENQQGNAILKKRLSEQEEQLVYLQNNKEDFDVQMDLLKSKYELRLKDLTQALEYTRLELIQLQDPPQMKGYDGALYSVEEEPSIDDLVQEVQYLKLENKDLQQQISSRGLLVNELALKQTKIAELESQLTNMTSGNSDKPDETNLSHLLELENLKVKNSTLSKELQEKEGILAESLQELKCLQEQLQTFKNSADYGRETHSSDARSLEELNVLRKKLSDLERDTQQAQTVLCSAFGDDKDENICLLSLAAQVMEKLAQTTQMYKDLEDQSSGIQEKLKHLKQVSAELSQIRSDLENEKATHQTLREQLNLREISDVATVSEMKKLKEELHNLKMETKLHKQHDSEELNTLRSRVLDLEEDKQQACILISNTVQDIHADANTSLVSLVSQVLSALTNRLEMCKQLEMVNKSSQSQLQHLIEVSSEEIDNLKNSNDAVMLELESKKNSLAKLSSENEQLKEQLHELQDTSVSSVLQVPQNSVQDDELVELRKRAAEQEEDLQRAHSLLCTTIECSERMGHTSLTSLIEQFVTKIANAFERCRNLEDQTHSTQHELEMVKSTYSAELDRIKSELESERNVNGDLKKELEVKENSHAKDALEIAQLKEQLKAPTSSEMIPISSDLTQLDIFHKKSSQLEEDLHQARNLLSEALDGVDFNDNECFSSVLQQFLSKYRNSIDKCSKLESIQLIQSEELLQMKNELDLLRNAGDFHANQEKLGDSKSPELSLENCEKPDEDLDLSYENVDILKSNNKELMKQLELKECLINNAALELEQLREKICKLEHGTKLHAFSMSDKCESDGCIEFDIIRSDEMPKSEDEMAALTSSRNCLLEELEAKDSLIKEMEEEKRHLSEKVRDLTNKASPTKTHGSDPAHFMREIEILIAEKEDLKEELKSKDSIIAEVNEELKYFRVKGEELQDLMKTSVGDKMVVSCGECADLERQLRNEVMLRESVEHDCSLLQNQCSDLTKQMQYAQEALVVEVKALSKDFDCENLSLTALIPIFLTSVVEVQSQVASAQHLKFDECSTKLQAYLQQEKEYQEVIEKMRNELNESTVRNEGLELAMETLQKKNKDMSKSLNNFELIFKKLRDVMHVADDTHTEDELVLLVDSKLSELTGVCEENLQLNRKVDLLQTENTQIKKLEDELKGSLELATGKVKHYADELEQEICNRNVMVDSLKTELTAKVGHCEELEENLKKLEGKLQEQSSLINLEQSFESAFVKLRDLFNFDDGSTSASELVTLIGERFNRMTSDSNEILVLQRNVAQLENENKNLSSSLIQTKQQELELKNNLEVANENMCISQKNLQLKEDNCNKLEDEIKNMSELIDHLKLTLDCKEKSIMKLKDSVSELQLQLHEQSKVIANKQCIQNKATSLYNDLTEKNELVSKLEKIVSGQKVLLQKKDDEINTIKKTVEDFIDEKKILEADLARAKAEKDMAVEKILKPSDEIRELKAEVESLKQLHEDAVKSSRDTRSRNRKLQVELNKLKEEVQKSASDGDNPEVAHLRALLMEEMCKRQGVEKEVADLGKQLSEALRSKQSRVSGIREKREARDARQQKAEVEVLKENQQEIEQKYKSKLKELSAKSQNIINLNNVVEEQNETICDLQVKLEQLTLLCKEKDDCILALEEEKKALNVDCDELQIWGRSNESQCNQLGDHLANVLKDLSDTKTKLYLVTSEKIFSVKNFSCLITTSLSKVHAEQFEMQLSSKDIAARNSQTRADKIINEIKGVISNKVINSDRLQILSAELDKEIEIISNLAEESFAIWNKAMEKRTHPLVQAPCSGCEELRKWGQDQEAKALASSERVDRLQGKLQTRDENVMYCTRTSRRKHNESIGDTLKNEPSCQCQELREIVKSQKSELANKNAEVTALGIQLKVQSKPAEDSIKRLEEKLNVLRGENTSLKAENRRITLNCQETTVCHTAGRVKIMKSSETQTMLSTDEIYKSQYWPSTPSGIVEENNKAILEERIKKIEREKEAYKTLCLKRKERAEFLEKQLKEKEKENEPHYTLRSKRNN